MIVCRITCIKFSIKIISRFIDSCVSHYKFNPFVDKAVKPVGTSYSKIPLLLALVPALAIAVDEKFPFPKFVNILAVE